MKDTEYVKSYKEKELRQYVIAYLLVAVASVGFQTQIVGSDASSIESLFQMVIADVLVGAICVLVFVLNELWPDRAKTKLAYGKLPSDTAFSDIENSKLDATGFDLGRAKTMYADLSNAPSSKQTSEWNLLLRKCRDNEHGNVSEALRLQLMTRDIFMSTLSLLIMAAVEFVVLAIWKGNTFLALNMLWFPMAYLLVMLVITRAAAGNRAKRLVSLVIKNSVQDNKKNI